jgi:hypothetical protein
MRGASLVLFSLCMLQTGARSADHDPSSAATS